MFIKYKDINTDRVIDVRTVSEHNRQRLFQHNLPIINELQHNALKKVYPLAFFIIIKSMMSNKEEIKRKLLEVSENATIPIIVACSRGRLRSPLTCIYAWSLGIECKVLWGGIKPRFKQY